MTTRCLENFDPTTFLKNHWQRQHLFIANALPDFTSPISADELAGLALEDEIESRIIRETDDRQWLLQHGPFTETTYSQLGREKWTLLVQAVDHYLDEIAELKQFFRFIPDWRLDDIMISFAPTGGGVGPHYDQYDVFLIQAQGQRQWKIGQQCSDTTPLLAHPQLKILSNFEQSAEYLCNPGDILYIPPGCAHWGISTSDDCMTISIGFRAPSHEELIAQLCDDVASQLPSQLRYTDTDLTTQKHPAEISSSAIARLQQIISDYLLKPENLAETFGCLMTSPKYAEQEWPTDVDADAFYKNPAARLAYWQQAGQLHLFINGQSLQTSVEHLTLIQHIADNHAFVRTDFTDSEWTVMEALIEAGLFTDDGE